MVIAAYCMRRGLDGKGIGEVVHQYKNNGYNIVLDVNSGSVHVVDDVVYDLVRAVEELLPCSTQTCGTQECDGQICGTECGSAQAEAWMEKIEELHLPYEKEEIREALEEILLLKEAGQLYAPDIYEDYIGDFKKRETVVKALCLHVAHDCNLACQYCFAEEGEYHGRRALMSYETGKKALDFLVANSGNRVNLEVDFFGGEPLMNWQVVKDLVAYGRSLEEPFHKKFRFTLTTNGVLLNDEVMEFANKEMSNVVLSIDGRKEVNDRMRPHRG